MYGGYLVIESHSAHPGLVRIFETSTLPSASGSVHRSGPRLLFAARFEDLSAGHMHTHAALRRQLLDLDEGWYRTDPIRAVAAADASELSHRRVFIDPELADNPRLCVEIAARRSRHRLSDRIWHAVGILALALLLLRLLLGL